MTIYSDLWYKLISTPRYDKKVAARLRRAHNHALQRRAKSTDAGRWGTEVACLETGKATGLRTAYPPVRYEWE